MKKTEAIVSIHLTQAPALEAYDHQAAGVICNLCVKAVG